VRCGDGQSAKAAGAECAANDNHSQGSKMNMSEQSISEFKSKSGFRRIGAAIRYSLAGLHSAWKNEHAFRQELMLVVPGVVLAVVLPLSVVEKLLLCGSLVLVLIVELINSAIEAIVDRVSLERHPLSKNAKDFGSAAVFLALLFAGATWALIVAPLIILLLH
jgi:diacylglycerol kinase (ATP)